MVVVLDCNIWISLIINRKLDSIVKLNELGLKISSCEILKNEITNVLARPKLEKLVPQDSIEKVSRLHDIITRSYKLTTIPEVVSDKKDNYLFALCLISKANYLVTGDKLLLDVKQYHNTKVVSWAKFRELFIIKLHFLFNRYNHIEYQIQQVTSNVLSCLPVQLVESNLLMNFE